MINGNNLPASFVRAVESGSLYREVGSWELKKDSDSFGNLLETELGQIWSTEQEISRVNIDLLKHFQNDGVYRQLSEYQDEPGFIEDILDFTRVVEFAISGDGAPFCFDFRYNSQDPAVIWWNDTYWRKISGNFNDFISLFATGS